MKKENINTYREVMSDYTDSEQTSRKKRKPQPYEHTGQQLLDTLTPETREQLKLRAGRPRRKSLEEEGEYIRTSFVLKAEQLEKLRLIADRENLTLKAIVEESFKNSIAAYEKRNGEIRLRRTTKANSAEGLFSE